MEKSLVFHGSLKYIGSPPRSYFTVSYDNKEAYLTLIHHRILLKIALAKVVRPRGLKWIHRSDILANEDHMGTYISNLRDCLARYGIDVNLVKHIGRGKWTCTVNVANIRFDRKIMSVTDPEMRSVLDTLEEHQWLADRKNNPS